MQLYFIVSEQVLKLSESGYWGGEILPKTFFNRNDFP